MVVDGKRDPESVASILQQILEEPAKQVSALLEFVTTIELPAVDTFVAREKFREDKETDGVKIWSLGSNFTNHFLGKTETVVAKATLRIQKLRKSSLDKPILTELGDTAETTLAHFWELLKKQGHGEEGDLVINGYANIAYIRDTKGTLWAVLARWIAGYGWRVFANSVGNPFGWDAGVQVISC